ncbi:MAG: hypothetical protein AAGG07_10040 [Planctomycetota bacterium]
MRLRTVACLLLCLCPLVLGGCIGNKMYNPEPAQYLREVEDNQNGVPIELAIIEFDDFGELWDRAQVNDTVDRITQRNAETEGGIVVAIYVHGWMNNADPDREENDLFRFRREMGTLSRQLKAIIDSGEKAPERIIAVYIGWRGVTTRFPVTSKLTFWNRQRAATRIAAGPMRETLARITDAAREYPKAVVAIQGHSLGGMIVAKTLEPVLTTLVLNSGQDAVPMGVDMVYLENPALEAIAAKQLIDLLRRTGARTELRSTDGSVRDGGPMVVAITSEADNVTKLAYRAGRVLDNAFRATRDDHEPGAPSQWTLVNSAIGHVDYLVSHEAFIEDGQVKLRAIEGAYNTTPFWVIRCSAEISADHGDIHNDRMDELRTVLIELHDVYDPTTQPWLTTEGVDSLLLHEDRDPVTRPGELNKTSGSGS